MHLRSMTGQGQETDETSSIGAARDVAVASTTDGDAPDRHRRRLAHPRVGRQRKSRRDASDAEQAGRHVGDAHAHDHPVDSGHPAR